MSAASIGGGGGITVTGGSLTAGAIAVGDRAHATVNQATPALRAAGQDDLVVRLEAVLASIERHGAALPDKDGATQLVERIATESARPKPDRISLKSFLGTLADQVKSVSTIAAAVTALAGTIGPLL